MSKKSAKIEADTLLAQAHRVAEALLATAKEKAKDDVAYSNRELDMKFQSIETLIHTTHTELLDNIQAVLVEARYTNGKVRWHTKLLIGVTVVIIVLVATEPNLLSVIVRSL